MSERIGNVIIIAVEPDRECEFCHVMAETRPYGPKGERICYACAQKDPVGTELQMRRVLFGIEEN